MATDKSDPRVGLIFQVGILAIVTLRRDHARLLQRVLRSDARGPRSTGRSGRSSPRRS